MIRFGTGAVKSWCGPHENTRHSMDVPCQPCVGKPAQSRNFREETYLTQYLREPIPTRGRKGLTLNWQNRRPNRSSTKLDWANKLQTWCPRKWSVGQTTANMATWAHMQAHGKASPCSHSTDHRNRWTHWLQNNFRLNLATFFDYPDFLLYSQFFSWILITDIWWSEAKRCWLDRNIRPLYRLCWISKKTGTSIEGGERGKKNPKYGQIRTESRLSRVASHLYLVAQSACHNNCEKYCKSRSILAKPSPFFNSLKNPRANQWN